MNFWYNGVDIYDDVSINYCVHEMYAEKQADTLVIRFRDPKSLWSKWRPQAGDTIRLKSGASDTGQMFVYLIRPENGAFTLRAMSMPRTAKVRQFRSWEGVRFFQLGNLVAANHGLQFKTYGCEDQVYPYIVQENESDTAFFSRLCMLEGCQMLIFDGSLLVYNEWYMEQREISGSLTVGEYGTFEYSDNQNRLYGSCEVASGSYYGQYIADPANSRVLRPDRTIQVSSNAEAARFARGQLRNANKYCRTGKITKELITDYAAASLVRLTTAKAGTWDGPAFIYQVRNDYARNRSTIFFRTILEGY